MQEKSVPKTGLAGQIRAWMRERDKPFAPRHVCDGLGVEGKDRDRVRNSFPDFIARGEIERQANGLYCYDKAWQSGDSNGPLRDKILKAMYVTTGVFGTADLMRLSEAEETGYVGRVLRAVRRSGHVVRVGRRKVRHGSEYVYRVADRERFRRECLK